MVIFSVSNTHRQGRWGGYGRQTNRQTGRERGKKGV
jgi:hypothetical protein